MVSSDAVPEPDPAEAGLVTVTGSPLAGVAVDATFMVAVIVVALTTVTPVNVTLAGPLTVAPATKPVPLMVTGVWVPRATVLGLIPVTVGPATTVNAPASVDLPPSVLVAATE